MRVQKVTFTTNYRIVGSALDFAYRGGVDVSGNVSVSYKDVLSSSRINAYILGGSGADAAQAIDSFEGLMNFIRGGGDYSLDSPGSPIAYKLNYLKDNEPAKIALTEDFEVRECARVTQKVLVTLQAFEVEDANDAGDDLEIYGTVSAFADNEGVLFDRPSEQAVTVGELVAEEEVGVILGQPPLVGVDRALVLHPRERDRVVLVGDVEGPQHAVVAGGCGGAACGASGWRCLRRRCRARAARRR